VSTVARNPASLPSAQQAMQGGYWSAEVAVYNLPLPVYKVKAFLAFAGQNCSVRASTGPTLTRTAAGPGSRPIVHSRSWLEGWCIRRI